jgi:hypothetical protein
MTFTLLATPIPSLSDFTRTAAACGVAISPQGLDQRLTPAAAACLQQVLSAALQRVVAALLAPRRGCLSAKHLLNEALPRRELWFHVVP